MVAPFEPLEEEVGDQTSTKRVLCPLDGPQEGPGAEETPGTEHITSQSHQKNANE